MTTDSGYYTGMGGAIHRERRFNHKGVDFVVLVRTTTWDGACCAELYRDDAGLQMFQGYVHRIADPALRRHATWAVEAAIPPGSVEAQYYGVAELPADSWDAEEPTRAEAPVSMAELVGEVR